MSELRTTHVATLRRLLRDRAGISLEDGKEYLVEAKLRPVADRFGLGSAAALIERVNTGMVPRLVDAVVEAMTINETTFFRDVRPFTALRETILPALFSRAGRIAVWCAASATGQEPYSLAMLLREHFPADADRVDILATDLSTAALDRAKAGRYSQLEINRGLPAPLLLKYFHRAGADWELADEIKRMVRFRQLNLMGAWPHTTPLDLVMLRNVLIYFDRPTRHAVLDRVRGVLRPDGWLLLGSAETMLGLHDGFVGAAGVPGPWYRPATSAIRGA
jgi:chemotaxis protein methyltransferase CheR